MAYMTVTKLRLPIKDLHELAAKSGYQAAIPGGGATQLIFQVYYKCISYLMHSLVAYICSTVCSKLSFPIIHKVDNVAVFELFIVKGKLISAKGLPQVGIEPRTLASSISGSGSSSGTIPVKYIVTLG